MAAHTLKSSSANVGATGFSETCRRLESLGRVGKLNDAAGTLAEAEAQFLLLTRELERLCGEARDEVHEH